MELDSIEMLKRAYGYARNSPDPSTQNGAVFAISNPIKLYDCPEAKTQTEQMLEQLAIAKGQNPSADPQNWLFIGDCNRFPNGVENKAERLVRPPAGPKYFYVEHAERNAIFALLKYGFKMEQVWKQTLYVPWAACSDCARAIIQSGVKRVVCHKRMMDETPDSWKESINHAFVMFREAAIEVEQIDVKLNIEPILFNGKLWIP